MEYPAQFRDVKCAVVIPTFNNIGTLAKLIDGVLKYCQDVIIVDDGCTDGSEAIIDSFGHRVRVLTHDQNMGKGKSLRDAFEFAHLQGFDYLISIDSDGQHFPDDLPVFLTEIRKNPGRLVIGARNMNHQNVPGKSSFGHTFSNFWFRFETGIKLDDTQSGYRLYPLFRMQGIRFFTNKFEFEIEVIVKSAWTGIPIANVPIQIYYAPGKERISHFRPFKDFTRVSLINIWFVILALIWFIPRRFIGLLTRENAYEFMRKHVFNKDESASRKALSIGFGIFMGIVPIWGYQMLVGVALAQMLKLNKALVLLAANISLPPFIPFIIFFSFKFGRPFVSNPRDALDFSKEITMDWVGENLIQYVYGAFALAFVSGTVLGGLAFLIIRISRARRE